MKKKPKREVTKPYEPTPRERAAVEANFARKEGKPPAPALKIEHKNGVGHIDNDHTEPSMGFYLLMEAIGTTEPHFLRGLLCQFADASSKGGKASEDDVNFMLSVVKSVGPQDEVEAMLAAQMAAVHTATMTFARKLTNAEYLPQRDSAERAFNKLARTYTTQVEALKRYRTGGEQKVTVKHVTVNEGGQAIVGNVETGGRGDEKNGANPMRNAHAAPRCTAHSKRTGELCRAPAVRGWAVCRMHGAKGGAPRGAGHGNYRHGGRTREAVEARMMVNALVRLSRETMGEV